MSSAPESFGRALTALYARVPLGMRLGLDPMHAASARAGHPERAFEVVHVAGTNGKGSTAAMVEAMARAAGRRTGLFTSPHLCRFAERIRIDGEPIADLALTPVLARALDVGHDLSFFETATLAAFLAFAEANVELAVVEVGIGGRLDATNVVTPRCGLLTKVAFDHTDRLGDTLVAIAREKAGIAKPGVPLLVGPVPPDVRDAIAEVATARGAHAVFDDGAPLPLGSLGLEGTYQRANARLAWRAAEVLGLRADARAAGLANARWPGRFERVTAARGALAGTRFVLDGAHNPDGIAGLVAALADEPVGAVVFGALADKPWEAMLRGLGGLSTSRIYVEPPGMGGPAARGPVAPAELARLLEGDTARSLDEALVTAARRAGDRTVVVCGSLYLIGAARALLLDLPRDPPVAL